MVRGHKDYGEGGETKIIHSVSDLGEHAARTGSINKFHRGGNVIFQTGFENGLNNCGFSSGYGGADYYLTDAQTYSGGVACYLKNMGIDIFVRPIELTKIGFEIAWLPIKNISTLQMSIIYDDSLIAYNYSFYISIPSEVIKVYGSDGNWHTLGSYDFNSPYINLWHIMKGIIDIENLVYDKFLFNHLSFDVSGYEPNQSATSGDKRLYCVFMPNPTSGEISEVIIDDIIITVNEQ